MRILALSFALAVLLANRACGQAADWDSSWDPGTGPNDVVFNLLEQPDGRVLIGGTFTAVNGTPRSHVASLNSDGSVDPSFDPGQGPDSLVLALARQPDGKVVIGGFFTGVSGIARHGIARLNPDGSLDMSFDPGSGVEDNFPTALAVQPDGRIIIGGAFGSVSGVARHGIARLNSDGTLDTSFDPGTGADFPIEAVALDTSNRILAGGDFSQFNGVTRNGLVRLNPDGSLDNSFVATIGPYPAVQALALQADGKLLVGGYDVAFGGVVRRLARLNTDGSVDLSFDPGRGFTGLPNTYSTSVRALAVQADGRILVGGDFTSVNGIEADRFARLDANGTLDTGFDPGALGGPYDIVCVCALALQADGKILLAGPQTINGVSRPNVARLLPGESQSAGRLEFSSDQVSISESAGNATLTVVRLRSATGTVTVNYATHDYTALGGEDFVPTSGTLTFAPGETAKSFQVPILNDSLVEAGEGFSVELSSPTGGARLGLKSSAAIFIADDDTNVEFDSPTYIVTENQTNALITVERHGAFLGRTTVNYVATNGTATAGADFVAVSGTLTFDVGEQIKSFSVPILPDSVDEGNETILLTLSHPSPPVTLGPQVAAVLMIAEVGVADASFNPGRGPDSRVESLAVYPGGKIMIQGSFVRNVDDVPRPGLARLNADGSLDSGFVPALNDPATAMAVGADGLVYVASGVGLSAHIERLLQDGSRDLGFRTTFPFEGELPLAVQADGKLIDYRTYESPDFTVVTNRLVRLDRDGSMDPGFAQNAWFENRLQWRPSVSVVKIQADGKILVAGNFTHAAGIARAGLARFDSDGKLDGEFNADLGTWAAVGSADLMPDGRILIGGNFTSVNGVARTNVARLNADGNLDESFEFAMDPSSSALAVLALPGEKVLVTGDFIGTARMSLGTMLRLNANGAIDPDFYPSRDCCVFSLALQADGKIVVSGSFIDLQGTSRNYIARLKGEPGSGAGAIEVAPSTLTINETGRSVDLYIRREGASNGVVVVPFATIDGTASAGADYEGQAGVVTFANGELGERIVTIPILEDTLAEGDESFSVNLGSPIGGAIWGQDASASITIIDNDTALQFATNQYRVRESVGSQTIIVQRLGSLAGRVTVDYATSDGTARAGLDYVPQSGTLVFGDGEINKTLQILILDDALPEDDETVLLTLSHPTGGAMLGTNASAILVIIDNDRPGTLDASFDSSGLFCEPSFGLGMVSAVAVQSDGRVLVGGCFRISAGVDRLGLVRLLPDGTLDPSFASPSSYDLPWSGDRIALQPDGKALVVFGFGAPPGPGLLVRLDTNGVVDPSFAPTDVDLSDGFVTSLLLQADGKILIAGHFETIQGAPRHNLARLNADGSLDTSFVPPAFGSECGDVVVTCLAVDAEGKILIGGEFDTVGGVGRHRLARLDASGLLDATFNPGEGLANEFGDFCGAYPSAIVVEPGGKVVVGGAFTQVNGAYHTNLARLNPDGTLDTAFNASIFTQEPAFFFPEVFALALQSNGQVLVGGTFTAVNGVFRNGIARLNSDGSLDLQFHSGETELDFATSDPLVQVNTLALQPAGQIVIGGDFTQFDGQPRCGIARLNGTRSPKQAVQKIISVVSNSDLAPTNRQPLLATLQAALASFDRGSTISAINQLCAFQNQVLAQVAPVAPGLAQQLWQSAQAIIDALSSAPHKPYFTRVTKQPGGRLRARFVGSAGQTYQIQATTNLVDWVTLGRATALGNGTFEFEDAESDKLPVRFYRAIWRQPTARYETGTGTN